MDNMTPLNCSETMRSCLIWKHLLQSSLQGNFSSMLNGTTDPGSLPIAKKLALAFSSIAIIANFCSLLAIWNIKKKLNANLRLIVSLCLSDSLVALSLLVLSSNNKLIPTGPSCVVEVLRAIRMTAHIVTLFNLLGLALDHYYAIVKTLYYRMAMHTRRITKAIITLWLVSIGLGFSDFYMPSAQHDYCKNDSKSVCSRAACTIYDSEHLVFSITIITLLILLVLYLCIFGTLKKKNSILMKHKSIMKKKKQGMITTILILGTFVLFWLPYCLFESSVIIMLKINTDFEKRAIIFQVHIQGSFYLYCVLLFNSLCDPVIYAMRMREVQKGYRNIYARLTCTQANHRNSQSRHIGNHSLDSFIQLRLRNGRESRKLPCRYYSQISNTTMYNVSMVRNSSFNCHSTLNSVTNGYLPVEYVKNKGTTSWKSYGDLNYGANGSLSYDHIIVNGGMVDRPIPDDEIQQSHVCSSALSFQSKNDLPEKEDSLLYSEKNSLHNELSNDFITIEVEPAHSSNDITHNKTNLNLLNISSDNQDSHQNSSSDSNIIYRFRSSIEDNSTTMCNDVNKSPIRPSYSEHNTIKAHNLALFKTHSYSENNMAYMLESRDKNYWHLKKSVENKRHIENISGKCINCSSSAESLTELYDDIFKTKSKVHRTKRSYSKNNLTSFLLKYLPKGSRNSIDISNPSDEK